MNITNRLYTYPVLSDEKDDYMESSFEVLASHEMVGVNTLRMEFVATLICPEIQKLLDDGSAEILIHIECSTTAYRIALYSQIPYLKLDIPIGRVNGQVERVAFITAKQTIRDFKCSDWNDDFEDMSFNIDKGAILAYQNLPELDIEKDYDEFSNASSIFMVYKRITNEERPIEVDMESNKIKIGLGSDEYSIYTRFYKRSEMQSVLNAMIILPALVYVFEELKQEDGIERYKNRKWYTALEKSYQKRGISFENEIMSEEKKSIVLAQEAMECPISKGLTQISGVYEGEEEEE